MGMKIQIRPRSMLFGKWTKVGGNGPSCGDDQSKVDQITQA